MTGAGTPPAEAVIDLGLAEPWQPPQTLPPRYRRLRGSSRVAALLLVAALAAVAPVADGVAGGAPVLRIDTGAVHAIFGGGRLFVTRRDLDAPYRLEARDPRRGALLWRADLGDDEQVALATPAVVVVSSEYGDHAPADSAVTALDAATGARLWRRRAAGVLAKAGDRIILQDFGAAADPAGTGPDPRTGRTVTRLLGADTRTGAVAWAVTVPAGAGLSFAADAVDPYEAVSVSTLGADGSLRTYDPHSGAVTAAGRLDWSGEVGMFQLGDAGRGPAPAGARAGQVLVIGESAEGGRAGVFDRRTGRELWQVPVPGERGMAWPVGCAPGLWCLAGTEAIEALDAGTGRPAWRMGGYDNVVGGIGNDLVLENLNLDGQAPAPLVVVDGRTGARLHSLDGWHAAASLGGRVVAWQRDEERRAVILGVVDPASGRITVVGRAASWYGRPDCVTDGRSLSCGAAGELIVWRIPGAGGG